MSRTLVFEELELNEEEKRYYSVSKEYREKFGSFVAREMFPGYVSTEKLIMMMENALKSGDNSEIKRYEDYQNKDYLI